MTSFLLAEKLTPEITDISAPISGRVGSFKKNKFSRTNYE